MLKIEKLANGETTLLKLAGRISGQDLEELRNLVAEGQPVINFDLSEVTLVDLETIRFLGHQELRGVRLVNCSRFVREWIERERTTN